MTLAPLIHIPEFLAINMNVIPIIHVIYVIQRSLDYNGKLRKKTRNDG